MADQRDPRELKRVPTQQGPHVELDPAAADVLEPTQVEPRQVEPVKVVFVPRKDFSARVNQTEHHFRSGIPTEVTRDIAAMLLEDPDRGYVKE